LVRLHNAFVRRGLSLHAGREVKHTGDGILAAFDEVANTVRAATDIQRRFQQYNAEAFESVRVRIGIHAGEPVAEHNDLFGATVHMAFRLCGEAEADGITVSKLVRDLSDEQPWRFALLGERKLKGFSERTPVFQFDWRIQKIASSPVASRRF
jgi:class 3 adenylate cyclase